VSALVLLALLRGSGLLRALDDRAGDGLCLLLDGVIGTRVDDFDRLGRLSRRRFGLGLRFWFRFWLGLEARDLLVGVVVGIGLRLGRHDLLAFVSIWFGLGFGLGLGLGFDLFLLRLRFGLRFRLGLALALLDLSRRALAQDRLAGGLDVGRRHRLDRGVADALRRIVAPLDLHLDVGAQIEQKDDDQEHDVQQDRQKAHPERPEDSAGGHPPAVAHADAHALGPGLGGVAFVRGGGGRGARVAFAQGWGVVALVALVCLGGLCGLLWLRRVGRSLGRHERSVVGDGWMELRSPS